MADYNSFVQWGFQVLIVGICGYGVIIVKDALTKLNDSVEQLNIKVAEVIEKTAWHEKWLERHEGEIKDLKHK